MDSGRRSIALHRKRLLIVSGISFCHSLTCAEFFGSTRNAASRAGRYGLPSVELAEGPSGDGEQTRDDFGQMVHPHTLATHRECSDQDLGARIEGMVVHLCDPGKAIFNLHCPPYMSNLVMAPVLDENLRPLYGGQAIRPVGSTSARVRASICRRSTPRFPRRNSRHRSLRSRSAGDRL